MRIIRFVLFSVSITIICLLGCKKESRTEKLRSMTLWDKPLSVIQSYSTGNWKLQYAYGGFAVHKWVATNNSYMILTPKHITIGNDSTGVVVDSEITWVRTDIGTNEFSYLLSYTRPDYPWPEYNIVYQIKNDTLVIRQYVSDALTYYYTKH
jgi:hypothetical protein